MGVPFSIRLGGSEVSRVKFNGKSVYESNSGEKPIQSGLLCWLSGQTPISASGLWRDLSGHQNHARLMNVTPQDFQEGALCLNGVNAYGVLDTPSILELANNFTITMRVKVIDATLFNDLFFKGTTMGGALVLGRSFQTQPQASVVIRGAQTRRPLFILTPNLTSKMVNFTRSPCREQAKRLY